VSLNFNTIQHSSVGLLSSYSIV